jgi:biotin carboxyl carrier protein
MSTNNGAPDQPKAMGTLPPRDDEGGLRAPPHLRGWRRWWWWFDFIILVKLARLRFIAILAVIGLVITQWDTLVAYYEKWTRPASVAAGGGGDVEYFCPMHPTIVRDNPKEKCPICFMPLSKRKKGEAQAEVLPAGVVNRVQLTPYRVALAGVQTWKVDYQSLTKQISAVGFIEFDERGQKTVSARVAGRIDQLLVNETGRMVNAGDQLASIYSPDLLVTVQSLLETKKSGNRALLEASRTRLKLLGIDKDQIEEFLTGGKANTHVKIRSPMSGHVIKKYVREGQYVEQGAPLYEVADLSTVWVQAQVYEDDLASLEQGARSREQGARSGNASRSHAPCRRLHALTSADRDSHDAVRSGRDVSRHSVVYLPSCGSGHKNGHSSFRAQKFRIQAAPRKHGQCHRRSAAKTASHAF